MKTIGAKGIKVIKLLHLIVTMMWAMGLLSIIVIISGRFSSLINLSSVLKEVLKIGSLLVIFGVSVFKNKFVEKQNISIIHTAASLFLLLFLSPLHLKASTLSPTLQGQDPQEQPAEQWIWHNPMSETIPPLHGRAWNNEIGAASFARMPERLKPLLPTAVYKLSRQSAGISLRFVTNSPNICVRMKTANKSALTNMSSLNESGVDLYAVMPNGVFHWLGTHQHYRFGKTAADSAKFFYRNIDVKGPTEYQLYLPNYNTVTFLEVGTGEGSTFRFIAPSTEKSVVVYGSSIIQGASPSRPGLSITNIVQRNLNMPVINLGFSGNCFMESVLFKALAEIDARAYVIDPIPNSHRFSENEIIKRITEGIAILRQKNNTPVVLVQNYAASDSVMMKASYASYLAANAALYKAYKTMKRQGIKNIYLLEKEKLVLGEEGMIEGSHPNDLGTMVYARAYTDILQKILGRKPSYK